MKLIFDIKDEGKGKLTVDKTIECFEDATNLEHIYSIAVKRIVESIDEEYLDNIYKELVEDYEKGE